MESSYNRIAESYYKYKARVVYGVDFFKGKVISSIATDHMVTFKTMLSNLEAAYHNLSKLKADSNLPLNDFSEYQGEGFFFRRGRIYGDINKARELSKQLISEYQAKAPFDAESNQLYELGLYLKFIGEKVKVDYVEAREPNQTIGNISSEKQKSQVSAEPIAIDNPVQKSDPSEKKVSGSEGVFGIFSKFNQVNIAVG